MIDLEDALARIVELAPEPPAVAGVARRARQRRTRRHGVAIAAALVVVIGVAGALALRPTGPVKRVVLQPAPRESVRVTLLNGSHLEVSGPAALGLTKLEPSFNGEVDLPAGYNVPSGFGSHSFSVVRAAPEERGAVVGRYPTADGHELVGYSTPQGVDAVVQYDHWALVVGWNHERGDWPGFARAFKAHETPDGFLVIEPEPPWLLRPTDGPDVQLGATFSFFGPSSYPAGCPTEAEATTHTSQGWPVSEVNGTWWCDPNQHVRVRVGDPALAGDAIRGLRVRLVN